MTNPFRDPRRFGFLLCVAVGVAGWFIGRSLPQLGSATCAILLGLAIGNVVKPGDRFKPGITFCEKKVLNLAVAGMGFALGLEPLWSLGWTSAAVIVGAVVSALVAAWGLAFLVKMPRASVLLVGIGTGICGASAIAAAAPLLTKDGKDIGVSVGVVSLLGIAGIFALPLSAQAMDLGVDQSALLVGGSLQAVGHVVAAGFAMSDEIGGLAVTIKMGRVALLVPLVLYLSLAGGGRGGAGKSPKMPWYLVAFLLAVALVATGFVPAAVLSAIKILDKWLLLFAMAAIGLNIEFSTLRSRASSALLVGVLVWAAQLLVVSGLLWVGAWS